MKNLDVIDEALLAASCTLEQICGELAGIFGVRRTEIGILRLEDDFLTFVYPAELQTAGRIPLSSSAVAACTATKKESELYNSFAAVPHRTVFELVKLKDPEIKESEHPPIQKLMSAPIFGEQKDILGVIQVSRKGITPRAAGPDFTRAELRDLERAAHRVATLRPEILLVHPKKPRWKLELQNEQKKKSRVRARRG